MRSIVSAIERVFRKRFPDSGVYVGDHYRWSLPGFELNSRKRVALKKRRLPAGAQFIES